VKIKDAFNNKSIKVPFFAPEITSEDKKAVLLALNSTLLTDGPKLREFENKFASFTGAKYAVGVSNATSALHLSLKACGVGKGDEVIIPDMTFVATASAVVLAGATPVLADIERKNFNISTESIEENISSRTKAILPVHFAGKVCDIDKIRKIAKKHNLKLVEDSAHAIGAKFGDDHVGTFGDAGCFSFYPTKNITTIEGGMVITNSKDIATYVRTLRNHGILKSLSERYSKGRPWEYDVLEPGYNYRLDEIRSALGISQLKRINALNSKRKEAFAYYNNKLESSKGIIAPSIPNDNSHSFHLYIIRVLKEQHGSSRDAVFKKLVKSGVRVSVHYKPIHQFTTFKKIVKIRGSLENTMQVYKEILTLPLYPQISRRLQDIVIKSILS
jgi:dTDP-4-amino-4,6-dideoxygalactose transaminase